MRGIGVGGKAASRYRQVRFRGLGVDDRVAGPGEGAAGQPVRF